MMSTIVNGNLISFKEMEQKIFNFICMLGREITKILLESYDKELDEVMGMGKIGLLSTNLAEKIVLTVTETPYRVAADTISGACSSPSAQEAYGT